MKKLVLALVVFGLILAGAGAVYLRVMYPKDLPPVRPTFKVDLTPERLARGRYLAHHVAVCLDCHSRRDWTQWAGPMIPGSEGGGGEVFDEAVGVPGRLVSPNITPAALLNWRDDEILRAVTTGVTPNGRVLFPLMGYPDYGQMREEDALAIVAYIRTLRPVENKPEPSHVNFPVNLLIRMVPRAPSFAKEAPNPGDTSAVGKALARTAGCLECHTPMDRGQKLAGREFAGGREFRFPAGVVRASNITPDAATGIGTWMKKDFIQKFKEFKTRPVGPKDPNTPMPWAMYQGLAEADLGAIYDYLRTVSPIRNPIEGFTPASTIAP